MEYSQKYLPSLIMRSKQESEYSGLKTSQLLDITSNPSYIPYPPQISTPKINHILAFDSANAPHETSDPPNSSNMMQHWQSLKMQELGSLLV